MFNLESLQSALREFKLDGWLFYDFRGTNPIARRILDFDESAMSTRRFLYFVPAHGEPRKLVHRIETAALDHLPGEKNIYLRWQELQEGIREILGGAKKVAMEYSANNAIPYVSLVDAGTLELVRRLDVEVVSSGDLIQMFEATLDDAQWQSHLDAERHVLAAYRLAIDHIVSHVRAGQPPLELEVQQVISDYFNAKGMVTDHPAIVAVGPHAGDPHYEPSPATPTKINEGDLVLIDLWAKLGEPKAVFADYTRMVFVGDTVPGKYAEIFGIVRDARDASVARVRDAFAAGKPIHGWEVDDASRDVIEKAGYGEYFVHRTGHSIAEDLHGNGTHMDNLETHDDRLVLPRTCFSVEPGIYTKEYGFRSEVNVFVDAKGHAHVTGDPQMEVTALLAG